MTSTGDVLNCTAQVVTQSLVSNVVPAFDGASGVVGGIVGHFLIKLETVFAKTKF